MKRNLRVINQLIRLRFQNLMMFRLGFFGPFFVDSSLFLVQLLVFEAIYRNVDQIGSWGKGEMIIYIGTFSLINALNMVIYFFGVNDISAKIKNGDIDMYLTKPISPLLRLTFERVNPGSIPLVAFSVYIVVHGASMTPISYTVGAAIGYIISILLMTLLWYEMEVMIRSISFYIVSTANITRLEETGLELCMKVPGVALKGVFKLIFIYILPYGIMATYPTLLLTREAALTTWIWLIGSVVVFGGIACLLWKQGIRQYNSVSS